METLEELLKDLSPELREYVTDRLSEIEDDDLIAAANVYSIFPAIKHKTKHQDEDDWFILPKHLSHLEHAKDPIAEGLRMFVWQKLVFAEAKKRDLGEAEFWSAEQIKQDRKEYVSLALQDRVHEEFYDANLNIDDEEFYNPKDNPEKTSDEALDVLFQELEEEFFPRRE